MIMYLNWNNIVNRFNTKFDEVFTTSNKKIHLDCVPLEHAVIDGARSKWSNLVLLNALIAFHYFNSFNSASRRKFDQQKVLKECIIYEIESMGGYNHHNDNTTTTNNNNDDINDNNNSSYSNNSSFNSNNNDTENVETNSIMYHIQFDEGDIWSNIDLLKLSLLRNSPFKSKDKFDAIINILFNHEILNIYNNEIKQFISIVVNKMINNKASYKLFRLPSSSSSAAAATTLPTSSTTMVSSLDNKKRKNNLLENTDDNFVCLEDNICLETSMISDTTTLESSSSSTTSICQYNNTISYQKSVGTKYKKKSDSKNNNNVKSKYYKKYVKPASTVFDYYLTNRNIKTIHDDDNSITTTSTASDDLYTFDASSIFDDLNDRINISSSSSSTTSFSSVQIKSTNNDNNEDDLQPWDFLNDNFNNDDVLKIAPQIIYKNNDYSNIKNKYNHYLQPFPLDYQPKRQKYRQTCCADNLQFIAF